MIYSNLASLILRLGMGGMILTHGWGKFLLLFDKNPAFSDPIGLGEFPSLVLAVIGEFVCPILLILGIKTRLASVPPSIVMMVAAFIVHADDPWKKQEFPLLYLVGFISIFLLGSGKYSLDWKFKRI